MRDAARSWRFMSFDAQQFVDDFKRFYFKLVSCTIRFFRAFKGNGDKSLDFFSAMICLSSLRVIAHHRSLRNLLVRAVQASSTDQTFSSFRAIIRETCNYAGLRCACSKICLRSRNLPHVKLKSRPPNISSLLLLLFTASTCSLRGALKSFSLNNP
jgi:hypothetical protein